MTLEGATKRGWKRRLWTAADKEFLRARFKMESAELARVLGRTVAAVRKRLQDMGLSRSLWTKKEEQFLRDNKHRGWKWCGEQLCRGRFAVSIRANALGLYRNNRLTNDQKLLVFELHSQGLSNAEIAVTVGFKRSQAVVHYLRQRGLKSNPCDTSKAAIKRQATTLLRHGVKGWGLQNRRRYENQHREMFEAIAISAGAPMPLALEGDEVLRYLQVRKARLMNDGIEAAA